MKSINRATLLGAVGQDPEVRYSAAGLCIASFSLATSEKRKDKDEVTQWHSCVAFGKLGEIVAQYIKKGTKLYIDGQIQYQQYEKDGEKRYATKIVVNDLSMLSSGEPQKASGTTRATHRDELLDDSIPF